MGRRLWLFDKLVWTVMGYRIEIWGWKEREEVEKIGKKYLRWLLGVDRRTPGYMIREEMQREKMRKRAGKRAWEYKRRIEEKREGTLIRRCWEKIKGRNKAGKIGSKW